MLAVWQCVGYPLPDLNLPQACLAVLVQVDVDREMGIDISHLVLVPLGHTHNEVVDEGADGAQRGDVLARAMVQLDVDDVLGRVREGDREMAEVLGQLAARACDGDDAGLDVDVDCQADVVLVFPVSFNFRLALSGIRIVGEMAHTALGDGELLLGVDVAHVGQLSRYSWSL